MIKKQLIMEKSLELFAQYGFSSTSVQEITDHCGISKGAFYLSFKSKDELIISLIEHFFKEVIADIDQVVRESDQEDLLYNYYYNTFEKLSKRSAFAKIFMKEQTHFFNDEFVTKVYEYTELMQKIELVMIDKTYGEKVKDFKYDMVYSIRGLTKVYMELFLFGDVQLDIDLLAKSLAEKTDLLAYYTKTPYVSKELYEHVKRPQKEVTSKEEIIVVLDEAISILEASIERESLLLLKDELIERSMNEAVITGLVQNIKHHPNCKWLTYLLVNYFKVEYK